MGLNLTWSLESLRLQGQEELGDACWTHERPGLFKLAVIDGLGHGREAALASRSAWEALEARPGEDLAGLMRLCHEALRRTRGAAISLAEIDLEAGRLSWSGVGNVEGLMWRGGSPPFRERLLLKSGIVGYNLPEPRVSSLPLMPGDSLVLFTDGIKPEFSDNFDWQLPPQQAARSIIGGWTKGWDDALVWLGHLSA